MQLFISHLPRCLRARRFSEPTFQPSGAAKPRKNTVFRHFPTFSRTCIFFLMIFSLLTLLPADCFFISPYCPKFDFQTSFDYREREREREIYIYIYYILYIYYIFKYCIYTYIYYIYLYIVIDVQHQGILLLLRSYTHTQTHTDPHAKPHGNAPKQTLTNMLTNLLM